jgi:1-deoxy-D-xylulose-5-phosphate synthase
VSILENIKGPGDMKKLSRAELKRLAEDVRAEIIEVVSTNGGHLASNLGVVELTVALHAAFDFFEDRLFFDVSHQSYTHKLLSGRADAFRTLRIKDGLSGFQNRFESPADPFTLGHAGSALSAAVGMVAGDELAGRKRHVVAVVGDGALATGINFEALNHAGALGKNMLVVLNDNKMSIAETVGAFSNYLTKVRLAPVYHDFKRDLYAFLKRVPVVGRSMERGLDMLLELLRRSMIPGLMFEELGFQYYGPLAGHDLDELMTTLEEIVRVDGPVLLHVVTEKGRGFTPASDDPERFHGARDYLTSNGKIRVKKKEPSTPSYTKVFAKTLVEIGLGDDKLVVITAAMPEGTGIVDFRERFPERTFDVGICEQHAVGFAAGCVTSGSKVVIAIYSTFLQRAYDQVVEEFALQELPVVFAIDRAGLVGDDGPTHHGVFDICFLRHIPGMTLMAPKDGAELRGMLKLALTLDSPAAIRYPRGECPPEDYFGGCAPIERGRAEVLREGEGVCIIAYGTMVTEAEAAARILEGEGRGVGLVNARFAKPLDAELIVRCAKEYDHIITVEEGALAGGFGSAVLETLSAEGVSAAKVRRLGIPDAFVSHGARAELLDEIGISAGRIAAEARRLTAGKTMEARQ